MKKILLGFLLTISALFSAVSAFGYELLINGDFEKGTSTDQRTTAFTCPGWRRLSWKPDLVNCWLTDSQHDWEIGTNNHALKLQWDSTSVCQYFSAEAGQSYAFSVKTFNAGKADTRWQPRIQVEWYTADHKPIGTIVTVVEADNSIVPPRKWNPLGGNVTSPAGTAYGRVLLNLNNKGAGSMWTPTFFDNASVQGQPGTNNLPVSFTGSPYPMTLAAIPESIPVKDSLTRYAEDKDGDELIFTKLSGPTWLKVAPSGILGGTPAFEDAGDNEFVFKVSDGRGCTDTQTLMIPVIGQLRLANVFNDDMVLQRDQPLKIWGQVPPNSPVQGRMSTGEHAETTSDATGGWSVNLPPMKASLNGPVTLSVTSGNRKLTLKNLLVGDVWVCSGQSNMQFKMEAVNDSAAAIAAADHPNIRLLNNPDTKSATPWTELSLRARWTVCKPATAKQFSAVAYYFGQKLNADTGIPIGLISANQGGTRIELWSGGELYNSRIHPYTRLPIKGVIWYQGEANIGDGAAYTEKLCRMVSDWRAAWGLGEFPFYFVQIAPFKYENVPPQNLPELWAAQTEAMKRIPHSGMVVINDVGNFENIHPKDKAPVGERLARLALNQTYGHPEIVCYGPMARAVTADGQRLRVSFDHADSGLVARDGKPLTCFEVAAADQAYVTADAVIEGETVVVSSTHVTTPVWVRFAWLNKTEPNLMNKEGLPANVFRLKVTGSSVVAAPPPGAPAPWIKSPTYDTFPLYASEPYDQPLRPQFHFTSRVGWLNDPNGMVYSDGEWHMAFQHYAKGNASGPKSWGNAVSTDLMHWTQLPHAINPYPNVLNPAGREHTIWSGSAVVDELNVLGKQQGEVKTLFALFTATHDDVNLKKPDFFQAGAYSTDKGRTWTKINGGKPIIEHQEGFDPAQRDPYMFYLAPSKSYRCVMEIGGQQRLVRIFKSTDLLHWEELQDIPNKAAECINMFAVPLDGNPKNLKWVIADAGTHYEIGDFDGTKWTGFGDKAANGWPLRFDYGDSYYAAQVFNSTPAHRAVQIGWLNSKPENYPFVDAGMPFTQQMSIPTEITLRTTPNGIQMFRNPVKEIATLYARTDKFDRLTAEAANVKLAALKPELIDLSLSFVPTGNFTLNVRGLKIDYDAAKKEFAVNNEARVAAEMAAVQKRPAEKQKPVQNNPRRAVPAPTVDGKVTLRVLVDRASLELFVNAGQAAASFVIVPAAANRTISIEGNAALKLDSLVVNELKSSWQ